MAEYNCSYTLIFVAIRYLLIKIFIRKCTERKTPPLGVVTPSFLIENYFRLTARRLTKLCRSGRDKPGLRVRHYKPLGRLVQNIDRGIEFSVAGESRRR